MLNLLLTAALALAAVGIPKGCPLLERRYTVPPVNGPTDISRDPIPPVKP